MEQMKNMFDLEYIKISIIYFILGGTTIVIALAWNNAFNALINTYFPNKNNSVLGHFIYAIILTLSTVLILSSILGKERFTQIVLKNYPNPR